FRGTGFQPVDNRDVELTPVLVWEKPPCLAACFRPEAALRSLMELGFPTPKPLPVERLHRRTG
ncbi:MAG TPA: hypothetical protein VK797_23760, partial [Tepidisphaeraceae bacterium]|nr:hypothetical protein [Tepidisphaeraceae bacterium]